ncbi:MAG: hypothetical protein M3Q44_07360 [bacterium]|nr:hypothetical protein [bacterium]
MEHIQVTTVPVRKSKSIKAQLTTSVPNLIEMSMEELVEYYVRFQHMKDDVESAMTIAKEELLSRLDDENIRGKVVNGYGVTKATRVSFKTSLKQALELGAVKQAVDTDVLKRLHEAGAEVPGLSITHYVLVKALSKGEAV